MHQIFCKQKNLWCGLPHRTTIKAGAGATSMQTLRGKAGKVVMATLWAAGLLVAAEAHSTLIFPSGTDVQFKYNNLELLVDEEGDVLTGIALVTTIGNTVGDEIYFASGVTGDGQLTGIFTDLTVAQISGGTDIYFTAGTLSLYNVPDGTYSPTGPGDSVESQICGGACPAPWLTFEFVPGIVTTDDPATAFDETTTTLFGVVTQVTSPFTGTGDAFLSVVGGSAASQFGIGSIFSLQSNLQSCPASPGFGANCIGTWPVASFDPVTGTTVTAVPEPSTIALLGIGLLALGGLARRGRRSH